MTQLYDVYSKLTEKLMKWAVYSKRIEKSYAMQTLRRIE